MPELAEDLTFRLNQWGGINEEELDALFPSLQESLHQLARQCFRGERAGHTLQPTALVNEAYLQLQRAGNLSFHNRGQFFVFAAMKMRQILVAHARAKSARCRGGDHQILALDEQRDGGAWCPEPEALVALSESLDELTQLSPRQGRVVALRFFAGFGLDEIAEILDLSPITVKRDWRLARAWLARNLAIAAPVP